MMAPLATQSLLLIGGGALLMVLALLVGGIRGRRGRRAPQLAGPDDRWLGAGEPPERG